MEEHIKRLHHNGLANGKSCQKVAPKSTSCQKVDKQLVAEEALRTTTWDATKYVVYKLHLNIKIKYCYNHHTKYIFMRHNMERVD